ncbi:MAG: chemotaxis protein CheX [Pseudobdellovibrio sp.]
MSAAQKLDPSHPFLNSKVILNISNGVTETLKTMAQTDAFFEKPYVVKDWKAPTDITVFLELKSDPYLGQVRFHFDKSVAKGILEKMLGSAVSDNDLSEILDGVGEISNIFFGVAKTKLNLIGFKLEMSVPHPVKSEDLPVTIGDKTCLVIPFRVDQTLCFIEMILY